MVSYLKFDNIILVSLLIRFATWNHASYGLFDFKLGKQEKKQFRTRGGCRIYRTTEGNICYFPIYKADNNLNKIGSDGPLTPLL